MEIRIDDLIRRLLIQMQQETALSEKEKETTLKKLETILIAEELLNEKDRT